MSEYILSEDLAVWFGKKKKPKGSKQPKGPWVNICSKDKDGKHPPCGRKTADKGAYPKCRAAGVAGKMTDAEKKAACRQKRSAEKKDTQTGKGQKPIMTSYKPKDKKNESLERLTNLVLNKLSEQENNESSLLIKESSSFLFPIGNNQFNIGYDTEGLGSSKKILDKDKAVHNSDYGSGDARHQAHGGHNGIDIFAPKGTPLVACVDGTIYKIGRNLGMGGNTVSILKDGIVYYYAHLNQISDQLKKGDKIYKGDFIGTVGNTGNASNTHPHLHFSMYYADKGYTNGNINPWDNLKDSLNGEMTIIEPSEVVDKIDGEIVKNDLTIDDIIENGDNSELLSIGSEGKGVEMIQKILKDLNYFDNLSADVINGVYDFNTASQIKKFQKDRKLNMIDGIVGIETSTALKSENLNEQEEEIQTVKPSKQVVKSICDSQKFCSSQGPITFGQLKSIVDTAMNKRLALHVGEGGVKAIIRLLPWFVPQVAVAGFIGSAMRAANKIFSPTLKETKSYKSWWAKTILRLFTVAEGDINPTDPFSKIFFVSDGLMNLMNEEAKLKFAYYISELASSKPDDEVVPEYFVENELRNWVNQRFLLNPPLQPKDIEPQIDDEESDTLVTEKFKVEPKEYEKLYDTEDYLLVAPLTHNASCKYGANTKWCTTNRDSDEMFDEHIVGGTLVYLIIKNSELAERLNNTKFGLYRGWGEGPGRLLVYDELNNEYLNGEQWLSNEFEKLGNEGDYYKIMQIFNKYYEYMDKPSQQQGKRFGVKESIQNELNRLKTKPQISEELQYHIDNKIPVSENVFRPGSEKYFDIINEARELKQYGHYVNEQDEELLNSDLGKFFNYNGLRLPLDYPLIKEDADKEMVDGIIQILKMVDDMENREKIAKKMISQFEREDVKYDRNKFMKSIGLLSEAEYQGKTVELGKPKKGGSKKWYVYVRNPKTGKIVKVSYGSPVMTAKWNDPGARASFAARHQCDKKKDRTKAGYWACRAHKDFGNNVPGRYW